LAQYGLLPRVYGNDLVALVHKVPGNDIARFILVGGQADHGDDAARPKKLLDRVILIHCIPPRPSALVVSFYFPSSPPVKTLFPPDLQVKLFIAPHLCYLYGMFGIGLPELVIIIIVALLVVGPARLPEVARSLGKALGEFRRLADDVKETIEHEMTAEEEKKAEPGGQKEEEKEQPGAIGEKEEEKETPETQEEGPAGVGPPPGKGPEGLEKEPPEGTSPDERQKQV
jgi:Tat protein translocase TatB subunit